MRANVSRTPLSSAGISCATAPAAADSSRTMAITDLIMVTPGNPLRMDLAVYPNRQPGFVSAGCDCLLTGWLRAQL